jgi:hypothetical protein
MRNTQKTALAVLATLAITALYAASASAVSVRTEPEGVPCPALTATGGGCAVHVSGEADLHGHVFGIESVASACNFEVSGRVNGSGSGFWDKVVLSDHAGVNDCLRTPCNLPWAFSIAGTSATGYTRTLTFCITPDSGGSNQTCTVTLPVTVSGHSYSSTFHVRASANTNAPGCEIEGQSALEGTAIELVD